MKIRKGFVSNSSTTSFCIYGACFQDVDDDLQDKLEEIDSSKSNDLEISRGEYDGTMYLGREWSSMTNDETGKQFKESIEKEITRLFGEDISFGTYEEAYRDG